MRKLISVAILVCVSAWPAAAQLGKQVVVQTGTPEDKQVTAIEAATNPQQKLALLNRFAATHSTGDMALMADELYVNLYSSLKNYRKAYEYGDKALSLDPNNLNVAIQLIRDTELERDTTKMVSYAVQVGEMVARYKAQPPPAGESAAQWASEQQQTLASIEPDVKWVVQSTYVVISAAPPSSAKSAELNRMERAFPHSSYAHGKK